MEFLGIGGGEFLLLLVLAVIMFGPEKLPEIGRKAARVVHFFRMFANQATDQLKQELGPEYQDLKITDLHPKELLRRTLLADIEGDLDQIKKDLDDVKSDLGGAAGDVNTAHRDVKSLVGASVQAADAATAAQPTPAPVADGPAEPLLGWDPEAT